MIRVFIVDMNETYCKRLLALLLGASELFDGRQYGVRVERPQDIAEVESVNLAATVDVVNGEGEGSLCKYPFANKIDAGLNK